MSAKSPVVTSPLMSDRLSDEALDELLNPARAGRELPGGRGSSAASPSYIVRKSTKAFSSSSRSGLGFTRVVVGFVRCSCTTPKSTRS